MGTIEMTKAYDGIPIYQRSWINTTSLLVLLLCLIEIYQRTLYLSAHENTTKKDGFFKSECKGNAKFANHKTFSKKNLEKNIPENRIKNSYWANAIKDYELYGFDSDKAREAAINAITPEAIKNVVSEILAAGNMVEVIMRPDVSAEKE